MTTPNPTDSRHEMRTLLLSLLIGDGAGIGMIRNESREDVHFRFSRLCAWLVPFDDEVRSFPGQDGTAGEETMGEARLQVRLTPWQRLRLRQLSHRKGMTPEMLCLDLFFVVWDRYVEEEIYGYRSPEGPEDLERLAGQLEAALSDWLAQEMEPGRDMADLSLLRDAECHQVRFYLSEPANRAAFEKYRAMIRGENAIEEADDELDALNVWDWPEPPQGGPPSVRYEELLRKQDSPWSLSRLWSNFGRWFLSRAETPQPEPLPGMIIAIDVSGSSSDLQVYPWSDRSAAKRIRFRLTNDDPPEQSWSSLFVSLCGDHLPASTKESPALWGRHLAHALLSPAGRIPELGTIQKGVLIKVLYDLPGWEDEKLEILPWAEETAGHCVAVWRKERREPPPLQAIHWLPENRCGFFLNRVLSYPEEHLEEHGDGLRELGGVTRALGLAWLLLYRSLAALPMGQTLSIRRSRTSFLFTLAEAVARAWRTEVRSDSLNLINACLVKAPDRSVIYLRKRLDHRRRTWGVCHELAHLILGHDSNSSYGLNLQWLSQEEILSFNRQEAVANAFASLWLHLLDGLADLGFALQKSNSLRAAPRPGRLAPAPAGAIAWAGAARADPAAPSGSSPPPS